MKPSAMKRLQRSTVALPHTLFVHISGCSRASGPGVSWLDSSLNLIHRRTSVAQKPSAHPADGWGVRRLSSIASDRRDPPQVGGPARGISARGRHDGSRQMGFAMGTMRELENSVDLLREGRGEELRERMARDGYVLLRGLLDREKVLLPSSASLRLTDYSHVDMLGVRFISVNLGAVMSLDSPHW